MDSDLKGVPELGAEAAELRLMGEAHGRRSLGDTQARRRTYTALLVVVVVLGLPIVSVPSLRQRLALRFEKLREAVAAGRSGSVPVLAKVGENSAPFPAEYERHTPIHPQYSEISRMPRRLYSVAPQDLQQGAAPVDTQASGATGGAAAASQPEGGREGSTEPDYRQGKIEQEAYDVLLKSSEAVVKLVQGSNPSLRFKTWAAAKMEEDSYWLRLTFARQPDELEVQYIWQVKLLSKQVTPLNYNARSLPR